MSSEKKGYRPPLSEDPTPKELAEYLKWMQSYIGDVSDQYSSLYNMILYAVLGVVSLGAFFTMLLLFVFFGF